MGETDGCRREFVDQRRVSRFLLSKEKNGIAAL